MAAATAERTMRTAISEPTIAPTSASTSGCVGGSVGGGEGEGEGEEGGRSEGVLLSRGAGGPARKTGVRVTSSPGHLAN